MKYTLYFVTSFSLAAAVTLRAFYLRPNFWSASILLAQSNGSLMVLTNLAVILAGGLLWGLQRLFYGPLRAIEVEHLYEKGWIAVTETLLSLTLFRDDIGSRFFVLFLSLMAGKIWLWIGEGRVEFLEQQPPADPVLFHTRLSASLVLSILYDITLLSHCINVILREARPGMTIMYGFEYMILCIQTITLATRYGFTLTEMMIVKKQTQQRIEERRAELRAGRETARQAAIAAGETPVPEPTEPDEIDENELDVPGWEAKGRFVFYLDLATDGLKALIYCGFFVIILVFHGLPIHIMRDLYIAVRSFVKRINDFFQYRRATKDMNERYSDATAEDLATDNTCIVCREEMTAWQAQPQADQAAPRRQDERQRAKKLPCGHILHTNCLRSWLERQRVCPTCRRSVLVPTANSWQAPNGQGQAGGNGALGQWNNPLQNNNQPWANPGPNGAGQQNQPNNRPNQPPWVFRAPFARDQNQNQNQNQNQQHPHNNNHQHNHQQIQNHNHDNNRGQNQQGVQPRGNMRVFNLGPIRIALGAGPPGHLQNMLDQMANGGNANRGVQNPPTTNAGGQSVEALMQNSNLIHQQIVQLQAQVAQMMQQLNGEYAQLNVLEQMVAELTRLQAEQRNAQQGGPRLAIPQALRVDPNQPGMTAQDPELPPGMTLPPGYTLHRLAPLADSLAQPAPAPTPTPTVPSQPVATTTTDSSTEGAGESASSEGVSTGVDVSGSSATGDNAPTRRTVTVEDAGVD